LDVRDAFDVLAQDSEDPADDFARFDLPEGLDQFVTDCLAEFLDDLADKWELHQSMYKLAATSDNLVAATWID